MNLKYLAAFFLSLTSVGMLHADYINGIAYTVPATTAGSAPTLGSTPGAGATEVATFTANGINFSGDGAGAYNLGGFLASGGTASNIAYLNGATAASTLNNTLWEFTGSAFFTSGQTFNVAHDDGVNMYVNGLPVLLAGGPTSPVVSAFTYTGVTGIYNFDFIYAECCGGTADFVTTLVPSAPASSTPEPASVLMMVGGLAVCSSFGLRRRFSTSSKIH